MQEHGVKAQCCLLAESIWKVPFLWLQEQRQWCCVVACAVSSCPCGFSEIMLTIVGLGIISFDTYFFQISFRLCRKKKSFLVLRFMSQIILSEVTHLLFGGWSSIRCCLHSRHLNHVLYYMPTQESVGASSLNTLLLSVGVAGIWWTPVSHGRWLKWVLIFHIRIAHRFPW